MLAIWKKRSINDIAVEQTYTKKQIDAHGCFEIEDNEMTGIMVFDDNCNMSLPARKPSANKMPTPYLLLTFQPPHAMQLEIDSVAAARSSTTSDHSSHLRMAQNKRTIDIWSMDLQTLVSTVNVGKSHRTMIDHRSSFSKIMKNQGWTLTAFKEFIVDSKQYMKGGKIFLPNYIMQNNAPSHIVNRFKPFLQAIHNNFIIIDNSSAVEELDDGQDVNENDQLYPAKRQKTMTSCTCCNDGLNLQELDEGDDE